MKLNPKKLESILSKQVKLLTKGRDESHGYEHMLKVTNNSKQIVKGMNLTSEQYNGVLIVSWLHDVFDHKYDQNG